MDDYAGRVLADRYRLPLPSSDEYEPVETRAFDTYSGQEVLVRQVPLPEVVDAEVQGADGRYGDGYGSGAARRPADPALRRAIEAAQAAAQIPDHPRLDQVFDVFAEDGSLWIVSELVMARPLAALLAEQPMAPYRAAEVASDVLTALRVLHAHGWTHRNITERTVLICDDGRVMLTGLAAGAAEEALCGYVVVPPPPGEESDDFGVPGEAGSADPAEAEWPGAEDSPYAPDHRHAVGSPYAPDSPYAQDFEGSPASPDSPGSSDFGGPDAPGDPYSAPDRPDRPTGARPDARLGPAAQAAPAPHPAPLPSTRAPALPAGWSPAGPSGDEQSGGTSGVTRAGAIAAYRAGARAAARVGDDGAALPGQRSELAQAELEGVWRDAADQGMYDPVSGTRVPRSPAAGAGASAASPYAVEEGPDSGRTRRAYDPVTGRWVPRPAQPRPTDPHTESPGHQAPQLGPARAADPHTEVSGRQASQPGSARAADPYTEASGRQASQLGPARPTDPHPHAQLPRLEVPHAAQPPHAQPTRSAQSAHPDPSRTERHPRPPATTGPPPSAEPRPALPHAVGAGAEALRADAQRQTHVSAPVPVREGGWEAVVPQRHGNGYRGPATRLAAERARQTRIAVVGAVTERWAPEQAGPVHENWRLAPPIGPATDLWALGALLFRAVQGHAPYPEESAVELVQMVCGEPPAFAEECGPLRPVVESLLRQDPTERPDFEELRGWLRSIVRSAPEPDAGSEIVPLPAPDATRLPIVRRRGELVRRRRAARSASGEHGRHRQPRRTQPRRPDRRAAPDLADYAPPRSTPRATPKSRQPAPRPRTRAPRSLGRTLVLLVLLLLAAALAYAVFFMPKAGTKDEGRTDNGGAPTARTSTSAPPGTPEPSTSGRTGTPSAPRTQTTAPGGQPPAKGYVLRDDPEGFRTAVDPSFQRRPINDAGQVRYVGGDFTLLVVPGRDAVKDVGDDPLAYQRDKERELQPFRDSAWATATGLRRVDIGRKVTAEGQFTWRDSTGRTVYVRNQVTIINGRYHAVVVIGPEPQRDKVTEIYTQATAAYSATR
ncbi:protein kinase [Streptomyces melanogenes]|uniref:protein kinase n=1 Tax=Streptomyces melanogenes TaxID=67326 RepID=UPI00379A8214